MKKKYKLKKSAIIIICIILLSIIALISFIISLFKAGSYSIEYNIDNFAISENYDIKEKIYFYEITYNSIDYNFIFESKKLKEQKLINNIEILEADGYSCLIIDSQEINTKPLCSNDSNQIDFYLVPDSLKEELSEYIEESPIKEETYQNYTIYNKDNSILIWSYKGFNYIKEDNIEFIKLFNKDIYDIPHATKINNYVVIPNYEQEYDFNELYIINLDNNEVENWKLDYNISYDSYILGTNDKSIYLVDTKNKIEYEIVPHRKKMRIVATSNKQGIIYNNGIEEKLSMSKLISKEYSFTYKTHYHYLLEDKKLYLSYYDSENKILISSQEVLSIVNTIDEDVFYLVNSTLYRYNLKSGETKLIKYPEWEFNNQNSIFIN